MKNELKYLILFSLLTLVGCGNKEDALSGIVLPQPRETLQITVSAGDFVTDGEPDTRATDNGKETTFEDGDRVGIIILDAGNQPIYDNIPYKYVSSSRKWVFDSGDGKGGCYYDSESTTYIVYYPYSSAADGVTSIDDLKSKFAPKFNQSDIEDYRSSDLMIWSSNIHLTSSEKELNAELTHAFASVYLAPTAYRLEDGNNTKGNIKVDVSLTIGDNVYIPYQTTNGSLRCIVPAEITPSGIRCFYTLSGTTYFNTITIENGVAPNTCYTSAPELISKTYTLTDAKVGDFYCKRGSDNNGYLIPSDLSLTDAQKKACLGIVMKVGKDDSGNWKDDCNYNLKGSTTPMNLIHGYVLALYDANSGNTCQWGSYRTSVNTIRERTGFYGYKNTQIIITFNGTNNLSDAFPATYHATTGYENQHSAPTNSSGWFLPSAGQGQCWLNNRAMLLSQVKKATGDDSYNWKSWYWSSTEYQSPEHYALFVSFEYDYMNYDNKHYVGNIRSCLVF